MSYIKAFENILFLGLSIYHAHDLPGYCERGELGRLVPGEKKWKKREEWTWRQGGKKRKGITLTSESV